MHIPKRFRKFFSFLGPGFVTGSADDDPSGIVTYSIAGARFGYQLTWMSVFLIPSMIAVQEMCGRIGLVTGKGLTAVIKQRIGIGWATVAVILLSIANIVNIGADLTIMADVLSTLTGISGLPLLFAIASFLILLEICVPYRQYVRYLTGLGLFLTVYIITGFLVPQDWGIIARSVFVPHIEMSPAFLMTIVGFLGTTISPYLFFWQPSEEVEEEITRKEISDFGKPNHISGKDIPSMRISTAAGMVFSNIITFFILITTASTLHANGILTIETAMDAANSLRPLAGNFAFLLFTAGILGIGMQSIPILAGSVGYSVSELLGIREGLGKPFPKARGFYLIIAVSTLLGASLQMLGIHPITALFWAAIINGVIAAPLIFFILRIADDPKIVGPYRTPILLKIIGWTTAIAMSLAAAFMIRSILP